MVHCLRDNLELRAQIHLLSLIETFAGQAHFPGTPPDPPCTDNPTQRAARAKCVPETFSLLCAGASPQPSLIGQTRYSRAVETYLLLMPAHPPLDEARKSRAFPPMALPSPLSDENGPTV